MKKKHQSALIGWLQQYNPADVKKGFKLFNDHSIEINEYHEGTNTYHVDVPSQSDEYVIYSVIISFSGSSVEDDCDCPAYEKASSCKHIVAAIIEILYYETDYDTEDIKQLVMQNKIAEPSTEKLRSAAPVISITNRAISENDWRSFTAQPERAFANAYGLSGYVTSSRQIINKIKLIAENKEEASWNFEFKADRSTIYSPEIRYDRNDKFQYKCTCVTRSHMCSHVKAAFDWLEYTYGDDYFVGLKDWSKEKAKLLELYGLKPDDEETKQIEFHTDHFGRLQMKAPAWLWGKNAENDITSFKKILAPKSEAHAFAERPKLAKEAIIDFEIGFLFNLLSQHFKTGFELETIKVFDKANGKQFKKLSIHNDANLALLKELPDDIYNLLLGLTDEGVKKYLTKNGHGYVGNYANPWINLSESTAQLLHKYYLGQLEKLWPY